MAMMYQQYRTGHHFSPPPYHYYPNKKLVQEYVKPRSVTGPLNSTRTYSLDRKDTYKRPFDKTGNNMGTAYAYPGQYVKFDVCVGGRPHPRVSWYYLMEENTSYNSPGGPSTNKIGFDVFEVLLTPGSRHKFTSSEPGWMSNRGYFPEHSGAFHSLTIGPLDVGDTGVYICRVSNVNGEASSPIRLVVLDRLHNGYDKRFSNESKPNENEFLTWSIFENQPHSDASLLPTRHVLSNLRKTNNIDYRNNNKENGHSGQRINRNQRFNSHDNHFFERPIKPNSANRNFSQDRYPYNRRSNQQIHHSSAIKNIEDNTSSRESDILHDSYNNELLSDCENSTTLPMQSYMTRECRFEPDGSRVETIKYVKENDSSSHTTSKKIINQKSTINNQNERRLNGYERRPIHDSHHYTDQEYYERSKPLPPRRDRTVITIGLKMPEIEMGPDKYKHTRQNHRRHKMYIDERDTLVRQQNIVSRSHSCHPEEERYREYDGLQKYDRYTDDKSQNITINRVIKNQPNQRINSRHHDERDWKADSRKKYMYEEESRYTKPRRLERGSSKTEHYVNVEQEIRTPIRGTNVKRTDYYTQVTSDTDTRTPDIQESYSYEEKRVLPKSKSIKHNAYETYSENILQQQPNKEKRAVFDKFDESTQTSMDDQRFYESIDNVTNYIHKPSNKTVTNVREERVDDFTSYYRDEEPTFQSAQKESEMEYVRIKPKPPIYVAPEFLKPFDKKVKAKEGKKVRFAAQVKPENDPSLKIDWYKDGKPLPIGSRHEINYLDGELAMQIDPTSKGDTGDYLCQIYNSAGSSASPFNFIVEEDKPVPKRIVDPNELYKQFGQYRPSESTKEAKMSEYENRYGETITVPRCVPAHFLTHIKPLTIEEEAQATFSAQYSPNDDPQLSVEWFKNGVPLIISPRIIQKQEDGHVTLTINPTFPSDSGIYTCEVKNSCGRDTTQAGLTCQPKKPIKIVPPLPMQPSNYFRKDLGTKEMHVPQVVPGKPISYFRPFNILPPPSKRQEEPIQSGPPISVYHYEQAFIEGVRPMFPPAIYTSHLVDIDGINEENTAHFEATYEPKNDPDVKFEWFKDGKPLLISPRITRKIGNGHILLDIKPVYASDSGLYSCVIANKAGHDRSQAYLNCFVEKPIKQRETPEIPVTSPNDALQKHLSMMAANKSQAVAVECNGPSSFFKPYQFLPPNIKQDYVEPLNPIPLPLYQYEHLLPPPPSSFGPPKFLNAFNSLSGLREGQKSHFEARLEPKDDPNLKVEWLFNGRPIKIGSRHHYIKDFGFVALDICPTYAEDSGVYTCVASNKAGQDINQATLQCYGSKSIITDTENPESLAKIQQLEKYQDAAFTHLPAEDYGTKDFGPPVLMSKPQNLTIYQDQNAHFQASYQPIDDSSLKVQWYKDGLPMKDGSRFKYIKDFGFIALDITDCHVEDSGRYTILLTNNQGYATADMLLTVVGEKGLDFKSINPEGLAKIQVLENQHIVKRSQEEAESLYHPIPPKFTMHLSDLTNIRDGDTVHFEARFVPDRGDSSLKYQWFCNGKPLMSGSRFKTVCHMGNLALEIFKVTDADNGVYECKIWNNLGEDWTRGSLYCSAAPIIDQSSINPESYKEIQKLEFYNRKLAEEERGKLLMDEIRTTQPPKFLSQFPPELTANAGDNINLEAKVETFNDPSTVVEWFHNGKPIINSCRITPTFNFNFATLRINPSIIEDSGIYTCRIRNRSGEDILQTNIILTGEKAIDNNPINPEALSGVRKLEAMYDAEKYNIQMQKELQLKKTESLGQSPRFLNEFGIIRLQEGATALFKAKVEPDKDASLRVEWFLNGKPLVMGNRHRTLNDFGYVGLSIRNVNSNDNGIYTCKISNPHGSATLEGAIECQDHPNVQTTSLNPESLSTIHRLEYQKPERVTETGKSFGVPQFIRPLQEYFGDLKEGDRIRLEAQYVPYDDPSLQISVLKNGKPILAGSRFRLINEFGIILLEIFDLNAQDSGMYEFVVRNNNGEAISQSSLNITNDQVIQNTTLNPESLRQIQKLEEWEHKIFERGFDEVRHGDSFYPPPLFLREFPPQIVVSEGQRVHLESRIEPKDDPTLMVEWFNNDKPLPAGDRFKTFRDFGIITLDLLYMYPEDSGLYTCRITNSQGQQEQSTRIICQPSQAIMGQTLLPQGIGDIEALEAHLHAKHKPMEVLEPQSAEAPKFTKNFVDKTVKEGQRVWFESRLTPNRDPNMKIMWLKDGKAMAASNRMNIINDFGFIALEITSVIPDDEGEYSCIASNPLGESITSAKLICQIIPKIISDSQYPRGELAIESMEKIPPTQSYVEQTENMSIHLPKFVQPLPSQLAVEEDNNVVFEVQIDPPTDPNRIIKWYKDDQEINASNRIDIVCDFGFVALYIKGVRVDDTGLYTCRAINPLGETMTSTHLIIRGSENIVKESMMPDPETTLAKIRNLETWENVLTNKQGARSKLSQRMAQRHASNAPSPATLPQK